MADDPQQAFELYTQTQDPKDLFGVVQALEPTIQQAVISINGTPDPLMASKARLLAGKAVQNYDPKSGAALNTWVTHQMQPLRRFRRLSNQVFKMPEGVQLDGYRLHTAKQRFVEQNDRDPTLEEWADAAGMSVKRIRKIQRSMISTPSAAATGVEESTMMGADIPDRSDEALDALYAGADTVDKMILEHRFGAAGTPPIPSLELMRKTKLSPFQLSRRTTRLSMKLDQLTRDIERVHG